MSHLQLSLLGPLQVTLDGKPLTGFRSDKERALLAYLAVEADRPHRRDTLGVLLWPELQESDVRNNLRVALSRLRKTLREQHAPTPFLLLPDRKTLQFNPASDHWLDVDAFTALIAACKAHHHRHLAGCKPCLSRMARAMALYRGDFLAGFFLADSVVFEEWALVRREGHRRETLWALRHLCTYHERRREFERARSYAARQIAIDPWGETAHRQLLRALAASGGRNAALAHYQSLRDTLAEELGVEPEAETAALYEQIREQENAGRKKQAASSFLLLPSSLPPRHNLPPQATPFIGRERELNQLSERLLDPATRLVTLVGEGGIGKTRLALALAKEVRESFPHGVWFVPLAGVAADRAASLHNALALAIAAAASFPLSGQGELKAQLLAYLRQKETLLVLDNFEHLMAGADFVREVLQNAPRVAVLVTSRERLNFQAEHVVRLTGLPVPETAADPAARTYSSVQLFAERAARTPGEFLLDATSIGDLVAVCRLVEGNPLAIELAAAWVDRLQLPEIVAAIQADLDFLAATQRDIPARHRSLRAVFGSSWRLLSPSEQATLAQASVFCGGFTRDAAVSVISEQLSVNGEQFTVNSLATLVSKSLLRRSASGRYEMHELLRQFAAEKRAGATHFESALHLHSNYYLDFVTQRRGRLRKRRWRNCGANSAISGKPGRGRPHIPAWRRTKAAPPDSSTWLKSPVSCKRGKGP